MHEPSDCLSLMTPGIELELLFFANRLQAAGSRFWNSPCVCVLISRLRHFVLKCHVTLWPFQIANAPRAVSRSLSEVIQCFATLHCVTTWHHVLPRVANIPPSVIRYNTMSPNIAQCYPKPEALTWAWPNAHAFHPGSHNFAQCCPMSLMITDFWGSCSAWNYRRWLRVWVRRKEIYIRR